MQLVVAFAAAPGQQCSPLPGRNSAFTAGVLTHTKESGHFTDVAHLLRLVRLTVAHSTADLPRGPQTVWTSGALAGSTVLLVAGPGQGTADPGPAVVRPFPEAVPLQEVFTGREGVLARLLEPEQSSEPTPTPVGGLGSDPRGTSGVGECLVKFLFWCR